MQIVDAKKGHVWYKSQNKQLLFHNLIDTRAETGLRYFLYGGAAKGGKSVALRNQAHSDCLQYARIRGLLIRSQLTELKRTHIRMLPTDLPQDWYRFNISDHLVTYRNNSLLEFGFFDRPENLRRYLSAEYDFIMIDELTTIPFEIFLLLISRLAASRHDFIPYIACATNPGDIGHRHVKSYFVDRDFSEEFPELVSQSEGIQGYDPEMVAFVPARIFDNPIQMKRDPGLLLRLQMLPPKERKRFYEGSWDIFEGQFFDMLNRNIHNFTDEDIPEYSKLHGAMDYGNYAVAYIGYVDNRGYGYIGYEWQRNEASESLEDYAISFKNFCFYNELTNFTVVCDTDMFAEPRKKYGGGEKVVDVFRKICNETTTNEQGEKLNPLGINFVQVSKTQSENKGYRVWCNRHMKDKWSWTQDKNGLWIKKPKIYVSSKCKYFWKTVPALITSKINEEDIDQQTGTDHPYDAVKIWGTTMGIKYDPEKAKRSTEDIRRAIEQQFHRSV